tara:strand:+ start:21311 stop:21814 length:504 start_codon:yes stop_codon:yes gene_type:complete
MALTALHAAVTHADLTTDIDGAILAGLRHDTSLTKKEKLFTYRCESIERTIGFSETPTGQATKYSCDVAGVGIALYAGNDLGKHSPEKVGRYFVDALAKDGVRAKVFIKPDHEFGSSMAFYINGDSWRDEPVDPLKGVDLIEFLAAESKLILFADGRTKTISTEPIR